MKQIIFRVSGKNIKIILKIFFFFSTLRKVTVGGFVNQLIKSFWSMEIEEDSKQI